MCGPPWSHTTSGGGVDKGDTFGERSIASYERSEPSLGERFKTFQSSPSKNWYSIWVAAWENKMGVYRV
jgi:hypothetical protein